jgi:hypothetical protein
MSEKTQDMFNMCHRKHRTCLMSEKTQDMFNMCHRKHRTSHCFKKDMEICIAANVKYSMFNIDRNE